MRMYGADEGYHHAPRVRERAAAALVAPAVLWQVAVIAAGLALIIVLTTAAIASRVARLDAKLDTLMVAVSDLDKRVKALDGKIEAQRAASPQPSSSSTSSTPSSSPYSSPSSSKPQQSQQPQTPAPGQILPKRKPQ